MKKVFYIYHVMFVLCHPIFEYYSYLFEPLLIKQTAMENLVISLWSVWVLNSWQIDGHKKHDEEPEHFLVHANNFSRSPNKADWHIPTEMATPCQNHAVLTNI